MVILAMLGYIWAGRMMDLRHRANYLVDRQKACYARDSALRYAFSALEGFKTPLPIARPNEPDFSDLFALDDAGYAELLSEIQAELELSYDRQESLSSVLPAVNLPGFEPNGTNELWSEDVYIKGPYGPPWPLVSERYELEIGQAKVTVEIHDENAKYPLVWALITEPGARREARAGLESFCEWMGLLPEQIKEFELQIEEISEFRPFVPPKKEVPVAGEGKKPAEKKKRAAPRTARRAVARRSRTPASASASENDFATVLNGFLAEMPMLRQAMSEIPERGESLMKYIGLWGSTRVNVNTAPRHVLEAAFAFGGDGPEIAQEIIVKRRIKAFKDVDELKSELLSYSESIEKCRSYITTTSDAFTVRVVAASGLARARAVLAVKKSGQKMEKTGIMLL
jgi:hypothetical protein